MRSDCDKISPAFAAAGLANCQRALTMDATIRKTFSHPIACATSQYAMCINTTNVQTCETSADDELFAD